MRENNCNAKKDDNTIKLH